MYNISLLSFGMQAALGVYYAYNTHSFNLQVSCVWEALNFHTIHAGLRVKVLKSLIK